jgi:hypothetical protein
MMGGMKRKNALASLLVVTLSVGAATASAGALGRMQGDLHSLVDLEDSLVGKWVMVGFGLENGSIASPPEIRTIDLMPDGTCTEHQESSTGENRSRAGRWELKGATIQLAYRSVAIEVRGRKHEATISDAGRLDIEGEHLTTSEFGRYIFSRYSRSLCTSRQVLDEATHKIEKAQTLSVTALKLTEPCRHPSQTKWWFRKGGYYRSESDQDTVVASPARRWRYRPTTNEYAVLPGAPTEWSLYKEIGLGNFGFPADMPTIGEPRQCVWFARSALRIEVDARKTMGKDTKLYFFFDAKTHDEIGISANLGSVTRMTVFSDLRINPKIDDSTFRFTPPSGWKRVKG